ncbi:FAD-dependent oxidoreductase [Trichocoleus sp. FACHB-262]|uniref:NAD(P)/FAD-dependent oxidoreductase n=1 Tax=Trichocoleus sp. FACHB-262 TaxID=2692869 RepID=UPI001A7ED823|nr:FAD-dependent oxidoreductase [Trichocoleus sp. FACHB-262]
MIDLAVIGAGPAGCAAAIWAAERGLNVLLIERSQYPRLRPGECFHPGIEALFRDLGVFDEVLERAAVRPLARTVVNAGQRSVECFGADANGPWQALHLMRTELDIILLNRAQQLGVTLHIPCSRVTPIASKGKIEGVDIDGRIFRCAFVIDASGQRAWLTRAMGRNLLAASPRLTAFYGYCDGRIPNEQFFEANAAGWQWMAQVSSTVVTWTSLHFGVHKRPRPPAAVSLLPSCGSTCGADVTWRIAPSLAGPSYFIVGDAAFVTDPASGNGVLRAIMSGMKAAHNAQAALAGQATPAAVAQDYQTWMRRWFELDTVQLASLYDTLQKNWREPSAEVITQHPYLDSQSVRNPLASFSD